MGVCCVPFRLLFRIRCQLLLSFFMHWAWGVISIQCNPWRKFFFSIAHEPFKLFIFWKVDSFRLIVIFIMKEKNFWTEIHPFLPIFYHNVKQKWAIRDSSWGESCVSLAKKVTARFPTRIPLYWQTLRLIWLDFGWVLIYLRFLNQDESKSIKTRKRTSPVSSHLDRTPGVTITKFSNLISHQLPQLWLLTALISVLMGQCNRTVRVCYWTVRAKMAFFHC